MLSTLALPSLAHAEGQAAGRSWEDMPFPLVQSPLRYMLVLAFTRSPVEGKVLGASQGVHMYGPPDAGDGH